MNRLLCFATVALLFALARSEQECMLGFNKQLGVEYVWGCFCRNDPLDDFEVVARVTAPLPLAEDDTEGRQQATVRCITQVTDYLTNVCIYDPQEFTTQAQDAINECIVAELTPEEMTLTGPALINTDNCVATQLQIFNPTTVAGWVC